MVSEHKDEAMMALIKRMAAQADDEWLEEAARGLFFDGADCFIREATIRMALRSMKPEAGDTKDP